MKYLANWEFDRKDTDKLLVKYLKMMERETGTDKFPKILFQPHYTGSNKGITILEGTVDQLENWMLFYYPEMKIHYQVLLESESVAEKYQKSK